MTLLIDTDAFCKLGLSDLLTESVLVLGLKLENCARLPALPYMLQKGSLFKRLGEEACQKLLPIAQSIPSVPEPGNTWLEKLTPIDNIDPGEAQLFASGADFGFMVLSDDKRSMRELRKVKGMLEALKGRIVVLEGILLALCTSLGTNEVRRRVSPIVSLDTMLSICFSSGNNNPMQCLQSYYRNLKTELAPLVLWDPNPKVIE
jgi:hypothetical protein